MSEPAVPTSVLSALATISLQESQIGPGWLIHASICVIGLQLTIHNTRTRTSAAHLFPWTELGEDLPDHWRDRIRSLKESLR